MSNETVVFHNERIYVISAECDEDIDDYDESLEDDVYESTTTSVTDIYSNEHRWDMPRPSYRFRPDIWCTPAADYDFFLM